MPAVEPEGNQVEHNDEDGINNDDDENYGYHPAHPAPGIGGNALPPPIGQLPGAVPGWGRGGGFQQFQPGFGGIGMFPGMGRGLAGWGM